MIGRSSHLVLLTITFKSATAVAPWWMDDDPLPDNLIPEHMIPADPAPSKPNEAPWWWSMDHHDHHNVPLPDDLIPWHASPTAPAPSPNKATPARGHPPGLKPHSSLGGEEYYVFNMAHGVYLSAYDIGTDSRSSRTEGTVVGRRWNSSAEQWAFLQDGNATFLKHVQYGSYLTAFTPGIDTRSHADEGTLVMRKAPKDEMYGEGAEWSIQLVDNATAARMLPANASLLTSAKMAFVYNVVGKCYLSAYAIGADSRASATIGATVVCRPWSREKELWRLTPVQQK